MLDPMKLAPDHPICSQSTKGPFTSTLPLRSGAYSNKALRSLYLQSHNYGQSLIINNKEKFYGNGGGVYHCTQQIHNLLIIFIV